MERTQLLFRTFPGSQTLAGNTTTILNYACPYGIATCRYPLIRVVYNNRDFSGSSVTFNLLLLQCQEPVGTLDSVTLYPGECVTRTYESPGFALAVEATNNGSADSFVDVSIYGVFPGCRCNC